MHIAAEPGDHTYYIFVRNADTMGPRARLSETGFLFQIQAEILLTNRNRRMIRNEKQERLK